MRNRKIPGTFIAAVAILAAPLVMAQDGAQAPAPSTPIVLKAAHLFDSVSGKLVDHGVVVVVDKAPRTMRPQQSEASRWA